MKSPTVSRRWFAHTTVSENFDGDLTASAHASISVPLTPEGNAADHCEPVCENEVIEHEDSVSSEVTSVVLSVDFESNESLWRQVIELHCAHHRKNLEIGPANRTLEAELLADLRRYITANRDCVTLTVSLAERKSGRSVKSVEAVWGCNYERPGTIAPPTAKALRGKKHFEIVLLLCAREAMLKRAARAFSLDYASLFAASESAIKNLIAFGPSDEINA